MAAIYLSRETMVHGTCADLVARTTTFCFHGRLPTALPVKLGFHFLVFTFQKYEAARELAFLFGDSTDGDQGRMVKALAAEETCCPWLNLLNNVRILY